MPPGSEVVMVRPLAFSMSAFDISVIVWSKFQTWPSGSSAR